LTLLLGVPKDVFSAVPRPDPHSLAATGGSLAPLLYKVTDDCDDGTETDGVWMSGGLVDGLDYVGSSRGDSTFIAGLRFRIDGIARGDSITYARLRLASQGGVPGAGLDLKITAVAEDRPDPFTDERLPSALARTGACIEWNIRRPWRSGGDRQPIYFSSPNLAPLVNELVSRPGWGRSGGRQYVSLVLERRGGDGPVPAYIRFEDVAHGGGQGDPPVLEIYPSVWDAIVSKPMLGRPTDRSVTLACLSLIELDAFVEYGTEEGIYSRSTDRALAQPSMEPIEIILNGLIPDTEYYYRLRYRRAGEGAFQAGPEGAFHTQRTAGSPFVFTIQADCHMLAVLGPKRYRRDISYGQTLINVLADRPDFHLALGDFAMTESIGGRNAANQWEALERYLCPRKFLGLISHSIPFYLVLGNHEGEQGWRVLNPRDSLEVWSTRARKSAIPNPYPDGFYSGSLDTTLCCGLRENYYAWHWGDALFVVLDPYWYTPFGLASDRRDSREYVGHGLRTAWEWTLGKDQYDWFYDVLHGSGAEWKFVFSHQFKVAGHATYEWGGEDEEGDYVFTKMRPGWDHGPIHDIMVKEGVDVFFHGHDHAFVYEELDGIVYQACPVPRASGGGATGFYKKRRYSTGVVVPNWGHVRVSVWPDSVRVDYVRSVLPADEPRLEAGELVTNASVAYSYTLIR
jgi:hypothetical protein